MTKAEFVAKLAESTGITRRQSEAVFSTVVEIVGNALQTDNKVSLPGLGAFTCVKRKARVCRNPRTGAEIQVPTKKAVKFSVSSPLAAVLNSANIAKID
jgi:DNA-binding protein HU-beta